MWQLAWQLTWTQAWGSVRNHYFKTQRLVQDWLWVEGLAQRALLQLRVGLWATRGAVPRPPTHCAWGAPLSAGS